MRIPPQMVKSLFTQSSYKIHHRKPYVPQIAFGNNSILFDILDSILTYGRGEFPLLHLVCNKFWLESAHEDYHHEKWGQSMRGLPYTARVIFRELYPDYKDDEHIKWFQYLKLRKVVLGMLQFEHNVPIIFGEPTQVEKLSDGTFITRLIDHEGKHVQFETDSRTLFYNGYRIPREHDFSNIFQRSMLKYIKNPVQSYQTGILSR